jgi:hypothetical protein
MLGCGCCRGRVAGGVPVSLSRQQVREANKGHLPGVGADSGDGQGQEGGQGTGEGVRWRCCHWCGSGSSGTPWCARCLRVHGNVQAGFDVPLLGSGETASTTACKGHQRPKFVCTNMGSGGSGDGGGGGGRGFGAEVVVVVAAVAVVVVGPASTLASTPSSSWHANS